MAKSIHNQPPFFGPMLPNYPKVDQICRIYASSLSGTNIYPAYVQQYNGSLAFRDREPCYVTEPNGIALKGGLYDTRLIGSYLGLPLFATTCCPAGSFDASSSSSG